MPSRDVTMARTRQQGKLVPLLLKAARLVNEEAIARVNREAGRVALRQSYTNLLPHIDFERGTRIGDLARALNVSKQAVSQVVEQMEAEGMVRREPDPDDARARRVRFTPLGMKAVLHGLGVLDGIERELTRAIGRTRARQAIEALEAIVSELESR